MGNFQEEHKFEGHNPEANNQVGHNQVGYNPEEHNPDQQHSEVLNKEGHDDVSPICKIMIHWTYRNIYFQSSGICVVVIKILV